MTLAERLRPGALLTVVENTCALACGHDVVGHVYTVQHADRDRNGPRVWVVDGPRPPRSIPLPPDRVVTEPAEGVVSWPLPIGGGHTVTYRITPAAEETRAA